MLAAVRVKANRIETWLIYCQYCSYEYKDFQDVHVCENYGAAIVDIDDCIIGFADEQV